MAVFGDRATSKTIVICAIDNLGKGAAGQAVQNANLALGFRETAGLRLSGVLGMTVTAPKGFVASGVHAGMRRSARDLAVVRSTRPRVGAAMFSRNRVQAACLLVNRDAHRAGRAAGGRGQLGVGELRDRRARQARRDRHRGRGGPAPRSEEPRRSSSSRPASSASGSPLDKLLTGLRDCRPATLRRGGRQPPPRRS